MKNTKITKILGYIFYGIFIFFLALYWTFPYDTLKERITRNYGSKIGYNIEIAELRPSFLTGFKMKDILIKKDMGDAEQTYLSLDKVKIRVSIIPLIWGTLKIKFVSDLYDGKAKGNIKLKGDLLEIKGNLNAIEIEKNEFLPGRYGINLSGSTNGEIDLSMDLRNISKGEGSLLLQIDDAEIKESKVLGLFTIPDTKLNTARNRLSLKAGKIEVEELILKGDELDAYFNGHVILGRRIEQSVLNIKTKVKTTGDIAKQLDTYLSLLNLRKNSQGSYEFSIVGNILRPRVTRR